MHDEPPPGAAGPAATIRSLTLPIYVPSALLGVGMGAIIPIVALTARDLGASVAMAGVIVGMRGVGTLLFDLPAGSLVGRMGERRAMVVAVCLLLVSLIGAVASPSALAFAASMTLLGCAWAIWLLARQAYVTEVIPRQRRGRALSTLGGVMRIGTFIGPFLGAAAVALGGLDAVYLLFALFAAAGLALLLGVRDPHASSVPRPVVVPYRAIAREHRGVFLTAGGATLVLGMLRASRQVVLPLWAEHIGLGDAQVGVIFGIAAAMDMTLFYPAGSLSDRFGRKAVAIPCLSLLGLGFALLPLTGSFSALVLVGLLQGFGNGLGSGLVMTLGSDLSPDVGRASFLAVWRIVGDTGRVAGPLLIAAVVGVASLGPASVLVGGLGLAGAALVAFGVPEPNPRRDDREDEADAPVPSGGARRTTGRTHGPDRAVRRPLDGRGVHGGQPPGDRDRRPR